jgi:hypothetical protein
VAARGAEALCEFLHAADVFGFGFCNDTKLILKKKY